MTQKKGKTTKDSGVYEKEITKCACKKIENSKNKSSEPKYC